jgi:type I restriction enzyme M protein
MTAPGKCWASPPRPKSFNGKSSNSQTLLHFRLETAPPFGGSLPISDRETLSQFKLGYFWKSTKDGGWEPTDILQTSQPPEILFIERCWQFLKPGGRMAIVLPDGILGNPALEYVRFWMMIHCRIVASIDLHPDTFQPRNGTQTSVLVLQRKTDDEMRKEEKQSQLDDYEIFMAQTLAIGHDKRGNVLYKRNDEGEEILFPPEGEETELFEFGIHGETTRRILRPTKLVDDDTPIVAKEFLTWKRKAVLGW